MYGTPSAPFPQRIVCLTSETTEIVFALGAGARVVGVPGTAHRPSEARGRPKVGTWTIQFDQERRYSATAPIFVRLPIKVSRTTIKGR